jgi:hypothetical protein
VLAAAYREKRGLLDQRLREQVDIRAPQRH